MCQKKKKRLQDFFFPKLNMLQNCDFLDADDVIVVIALVLKASRMTNEFEKCKLKIISYHFNLNF